MDAIFVDRNNATPSKMFLFVGAFEGASVDLLLQIARLLILDRASNRHSSAQDLLDRACAEEEEEERNSRPYENSRIECDEDNMNDIGRWRAEADIPAKLFAMDRGFMVRAISKTCSSVTL